MKYQQCDTRSKNDFVFKQTYQIKISKYLSISVLHRQAVALVLKHFYPFIKHGFKSL